LSAKTAKFSVMEPPIIPTLSTKDAKDKTYATLRLKTKLVYIVLLTPPRICAQKLAHLMKFCVILMKDLLGAKAHTHVKPDPQMTWMNIALALLIVQSIAKPTNTTVQQEKMKMDASYLMNVSKKNEDLTESSAHSTAQKNVMKANFSAPEALMKLDAKLQVNVEIRKNTNGDPVLKLSQKLNALDTVHPNVLPMKSYAHHS